MASEGPREPAGERTKLSADVKPFVPKFAGLGVAWLESSEAGVLPSCASTYYPCVQQLPVPGQKLYPEAMSFGASTFPPQYQSSEMALPPYYSPCTTESAQGAGPGPSSLCGYTPPSPYRSALRAKPRGEHRRPNPQDTKPLLKKKTHDEKKFDNKEADGTVSSDIKSVKGSYHMSIHAETNLKSGGCHKRTDRKSRILEKSGPASQPEFEFTKLDFPELQGVEKNEGSETPKPPKWGPLLSASADMAVGRAAVRPAATALAQGEIVVKNNNPTDSVTDKATTNPSSCTREFSWTPMGYVVWQTLPTEPPPAPRHVPSMIKLEAIASSADPKRGSASAAHLLSSVPSCSRGKPVVHPAEKSTASQSGVPQQNAASRESKTNEEKSKSKCEVLAVQEPPRIEDAEEFPNLAVACERRDRVESPKCQSKLQPQSNFKSSRRKSQVPVQLDLGGMLTALEKQQSSTKQLSRPVVVSVGAVPVLSKEATSGKKGLRFSQVKTPHNPLDSSAPLTKKGKQREVPKAKKPTSLKKIILKERQERMQQRLQEHAVSPVCALDVCDAESGGSDPAPELQGPSGLWGADVTPCSAPGVMSGSEELLGPEIHREAETCPVARDAPSWPKIHSRRFRDYCSQVLSKEVDACVMDLLKELVRFQDRMYQKDPVKAKTKRRLVLGLREVLKHLRLRKLKCIIISPNCEKIQSKGGLDDTLHTIISHACEQNIPFVFALNRKALGRSLNKAVPVSVVGIFSYDGAQDQFHKMVELTVAARQAYRTMLENVHRELVGELSAPGPSCPAGDGAPAPASTEEPGYMEIWRRRLDTYSQHTLELEESLEASTAQMMNLNL